MSDIVTFEDEQRLARDVVNSDDLTKRLYDDPIAMKQLVYLRAVFDARDEVGVDQYVRNIKQMYIDEKSLIDIDGVKVESKGNQYLEDSAYYGAIAGVQAVIQTELKNIEIFKLNNRSIIRLYELVRREHPAFKQFRSNIDSLKDLSLLLSKCTSKYKDGRCKLAENGES